MAQYLDSIPFSGIIRIRDMMYGVKNPFRLDQGDVSFDAPDTVKNGMRKAIDENRSHYLQTNGLPRLRELIAAKMRDKNGIAGVDAEDVMVSTGGIHAVYILAHALLEEGEEVLMPDPEWPPAVGNMLTAKATVVPYPLHENLGWRPDIDQIERLITPKTRLLYVNTPNNPSGGVLTRSDIERLAALAQAHKLWVISDEAYEDVIFSGKDHVSLASLPGMYARTIPLYTMSKSYAMTGLRLGYFAVKDAVMRERCRKLLLYTASNISSVVQYGGIGALEGSQQCIVDFKTELEARRDLFYKGIADMGGTVLSGNPPDGAFYAFLKINPAWAPPGGRTSPSLSWSMAEFLIKNGRIGCVPGVDFGGHGENHIRFCFARGRTELQGALDSMKSLFAV